MPVENSESESQPEERALRPVIPASDYALRDRWALIVGISTYQHERWNLQYAHRDAEALYDLIHKPSGGGFDDRHIRKLINDQATTRNVYKALRSFLKGPKAEDVVLIYLACHGAPDPDLPENVYLITYDTDPDDISGTAVPMREIDLSLQENLKAKRTIIIADACHSGVLGGKGLRSADETAPVNRYLQSLSESQAGGALLTSARSNETSREDAKWGEGHGVFTYYLLKGMEGEADRNPKNGIVTVGELFDYVWEKVREATDGKQNPYTGPGPVFDWPMAWTGGRSAQEHQQLGQGLMDLGWRTGDSGRFQSAAVQFAEALHFARLDRARLSEANLGRGHALLAAGRYEEAVAELSEVTKRKKAAREHPRAHLYQGMAYARMGQKDKAAKALQAFAEQAPQDEIAAWAAEYAQWLTAIQSGKRYALLIGVNQYLDPLVSTLRGCLNDVQSMGMVLTSRFGFADADVVVLGDTAATRQGVADAFARLMDVVTPYDSVIIFYSGHSCPGDVPGYWILHDTIVGSREAWTSGQIQNGIGAGKLHEWMQGLATKHKTLILDTHPNSRLLQRARQEGDYALLIASIEGPTMEQTVEWQGERISMGAFTYAFVQQLQQVDPTEVTYSQVIYPVRDVVQGYFPNQKPDFIGPKERRLFAEADEYASAFEFSQRRSYEALTLEDVQARYARCRDQVRAPFPAVHASFGRAFLDKGSYEEAIAAFATAVAQRGEAEPAATLALALAQAGAQRWAEALQNLQAYVEAVPRAGAPLREAISAVEHLRLGRKTGLLVGINEYASADVPSLKGAVNDVLALKSVLLKRYGFEEDDMVVLLDSQATRERILQELTELAERSRYRPALFYFAGRGSMSAEGVPAIISADGRQAEVYDITLRELAALDPGRASNLTTVIDAGWTPVEEEAEKSRTLAADTRRRPAERFLGIDRDEGKYGVRVGRVSIYNPSIQKPFSKSPDQGTQERRLPALEAGDASRVHGQMTHALVKGLWQADPATLTYAQWLESLPHKPYVLGKSLDEPLFCASLSHAALRQWAALEGLEPVNQTIELLRRLVQRYNDHYPEGHLNLGVAYAYLQEYDKAIDHMRKAIEQKEPYPEAHYHLGRVLLRSGRDAAGAVSELRQAIVQDEGNVASRYYLGQALQAFVERDVLVEAEEAYRQYLAGGAPLGQEAQVQAFLDARQAERRRALTR
jgi:tetratricopeptide (TPR) repeat protein